MPSPATFFLNSGSNVVQLDLIELAHPNFTKTYRIVRNAVAGVTVTLEDTTVKTFDYYPVRLVPTGSKNDLDQTLEVTFGDLGTILPQELDRIIRAKTPPFFTGALLGAWVDNTAQMVLPPFLIAQGGWFYVPANATHLQMGINDSFFFDNNGSFAVSVNGAAPVSVGPFERTWTYTAGVLNDAYPYSPTSTGPPRSVVVTPGSLIKITVSGGTSVFAGGFVHDGFGDPTVPNAGPGLFVELEPGPGSIIKPTLTYRVYRSDDLTAPLDGPFLFQVNNIAFQKDGATLQCSASRLNQNTTGELYSMDRFPMLRGFL
jgi:hypothetical protein